MQGRSHVLGGHPERVTVTRREDYPASRTVAALVLLLIPVPGFPRTPPILSQPDTPKRDEVLSKERIVAIMRRVSDWQLSDLSSRRSGRYVGWPCATFFTGLMATYHSTKDPKYLEAMLAIAKGNRWKLGKRLRHADDHCIGQAYCELYLIQKDPQRLASTRETFDRIMDRPKRGREDWWWCDALFMSPPVWARLSTATGERKYLDFMNQLWWDTTEFLYDKQERLFFRDGWYKIRPEGRGPRERNGSKVFWSRGNGWVLAGLVRVLQYMPRDYPDRPKYVALLREMAARLASLQCPDGFWRASLLDPKSYPGGETSGTGFFCYAMAWALNHRILNRRKYVPIVRNAWKALNTAVQESGKVGWVQPCGSGPARVTANNSFPYGAGAFLLAGSEVLKLNGSEAQLK